MKISIDIQAILRFSLSNLNGCKFHITDGKKLRSAPVEMGSGDMIRVRSFMMIGKGVKGILRFGLINLKGCFVGIAYVSG
jgi:hypothetical protein